jgi:pimeloyl-ACP methyl ester carboxylesterase
MADPLPLHPITINGAELHYIEQGTGDPVVFVHGGLGDYRTWLPQMAPFARHYRAIAYSRRSHYPNAWASGYTRAPLWLHVADLAALIAQVAGGPVHLVANSYGGYISLFLALAHPALVRTLALGEPPVHPLQRRVPEGAALFDAFMTAAWQPARQAFAGGALEEGVRLFINGVVGPNAYERLPPAARAGLLTNAPAMAVETLTDFADYMPDLPCAEAATIAAPTLLLNGARSPRMYHIINGELARCLPHVEQVTIADAAHVLHAQNPAAHNAAVLAFLARH